MRNTKKDLDIDINIDNIDININIDIDKKKMIDRNKNDNQNPLSFKLEYLSKTIKFNCNNEVIFFKFQE